MAAITPIDLRELQNKAGAPAYPDSPANTIYAQDWNPIRSAISKGLASISTLGIVLGSDGLCTLGTTPVNMSLGLLRFEDAENEDVQVGYLSNTGELGMVALRADQQLILAADVAIVHEGDAARSVPEETPTDWHLVTSRGAGTVEDFEVYHDGTLEVIRKLQGDWAADKIGSGLIMRYAGGLARIRLNASGEPVIEDVADYSARPITYTNERRLMTGEDVFVSDVTADPLSPIVVTEPSSDPKLKQISIASIPASALEIGSGTDDVNVDNLFAGGGGIGSLAALTTPAEKALISTNAAAIAAIQAELLTVVKSFRTSGGQVITPDATGRVQVANSSSVLWDKPTTNTIRAVSSGGGGGGGSVDSVTGGDGIENVGTSANPILKVDLAVGQGLEFSGGELRLEWAGTAGDFGTSTLAARSDHAHDATYSALGHSHAGMALISDITYETLDGNGDVGTVASTLAAGNDSRFHTQNTDTGSTLDGVFTIDSARVTTPGSGQRGFGVERGASSNAVIVFDDADDTWKAGLASGPVAIILEGDARLTDARTPTTHTLASHSGSLAAASVAPAYVPSAYTPASSTVDGHLAGIDSAVGSVVGQDEETFNGYATVISLTELLIGDPSSGGVTVRRAGTVNVGRLRASADLGGGQSIEVTVANETTPASATITIGPGVQSAEELSLGIPFSAGEKLSVTITGLVGGPTVDFLHVELVRE